jgi:hypothetical protein
MRQRRSAESSSGSTARLRCTAQRARPPAILPACRPASSARPSPIAALTSCSAARSSGRQSSAGDSRARVRVRLREWRSSNKKWSSFCSARRPFTSTCKGRGR